MTIGGDYGTLGTAIGAAVAARTRLDTLTGQAADGLKADSYAGLGAATVQSVSLQPAIKQLAVQSSAIDQAGTRLSVTQTALNQIESIASSFRAQTAELNAVTPTQVDSVAASAKLALQQVANLLDTTSAGEYVFAGTDTGTAPVPDPDNITSSGFYTQTAAAVSGLATNGAAATSSATLAIAASNTTGTTPFAGTGTVPTLNLGDGGTVQVGLLASQNTLATSSGSSTTGSYMRDILRGLATLASLSSGQVAASGFTDLVKDTQASLTGAVTALTHEQGTLGNIQSQLTGQQTAMTATSTALNKQLSSAQDVDMATTLSELSQVQTQLSASYKLIATVSQLSLVNSL